MELDIAREIIKNEVRTVLKKLDRLSIVTISLIRPPVRF